MLNKIFLFIGILTVNMAISQNLDGLSENPPLSASGNISVGGFFYNASGINDRQNPYGYSLNANTNFKLYGWSVPVSVVVNEQGSAFRNPFNRFGISPEYKWLKVHLGHRNLHYSPFTLSGTTFFGVGIELNPGKLRIAAMNGRFREANEGNDPNYIFPQFKRKGYAFKVGFGGDKGYFDLIYLKAEDDIESLNLVDSIANKIDAHENAVFGVSTRIPFFKNKLFFKLDGGISAFTEDVRGFQLDDKAYPQLDHFDFILRPNISTSLNYAGEASLNLQLKGFSFSTRYRRVMPDFQSLGTNYLLDDVENITINPTFSLLQNKIIFSGSYGIQRNNLLEQRTSDTFRRIGSANVSINPSHTYGINLQYSNYSLNQQVIRDTILNDSLLIDQINHNISIMPRFSIIGTEVVHNFFVLANFQKLDDQNPGTEQFADNNIVLLNATYMMNFLVQKMNLRLGFNYFDFSSNLLGNQRYGFTVGITKRLLEDKISLTANGTYNFIDQNEISGNNYNVSFLTRYKIVKNSSISLQLFFLGNSVGSSDFQEVRGQLRFNQRF